MKRIFSIFSLCLLALLFFSCSGAMQLQKSINSYTTALGYVYDSPVSACPRSDSMVVIYNGLDLNNLTTVSKARVKLFPFLFVNYFEKNFRVKLGQNLMEQDYNDFFFDAFLDESDRSGCYALRYDSTYSDSVYTLEITLDTCETNSKYRQSSLMLYFIYAYSISYSEKGLPAETRLAFTARLKKGRTLISEKRYSIRKSLPFMRSGQDGTNGLRADFVYNMVQSLNLGTKDCVEAIVRDVNASIGSGRFSNLPASSK